MSLETKSISPITKNSQWKQQGITVAGGNGVDDQLNQLSGPCGICIDDDQTISIADCDNNRIVEWKLNATNGRIVAGGNGQGNEMNQLSCPTDVIIDKRNNSLIITDKLNKRVMEWSRQSNTTNGQVIISDVNCRGLTMDKNGDIYVSDAEKNEVRRWTKGEKQGKVVAGGNGKGNQLNQLNWPTYLYVDENLSLYVSDFDNHRVMKWVNNAKEGIIVAGGNGIGNSLTQFNSPKGLFVDQLDQIYIADKNNHRIIRWCQRDKQGSIIVGGNGEGQGLNQLYYPESLAFDRQGNLYVADCNNHRILKFIRNRNG